MPDSPIKSDNRSFSRGRETFQSSGRGGIGNIRPSSQSRDSRPYDGPDDFSDTRGREPTVHPDRVFSVGRGGAGNIRSPSRDALKSVQSISEDTLEDAEYEARLIKEHADATTIHSSGRGGLGNISGSRSRSRGPSTAMHSTGRGGAGNMYSNNNPAEVELPEEDHRKDHIHHDAVHSTGRGGAANITHTHEPEIERVSHHLGEFESSGRGGAGNIRSRSGSRGGRANSKERHKVSAFWDKLSHPHQAHTPDERGTSTDGDA